MAGSIEREIKLRLPSADAARALAARLGAATLRPVLQTNHFFDTAARDLRRAELALRLRAEAGRWTVTLKGRERGGSAELAERPEEEREVDARVAHALLAGTTSPLDALAAELGENALLARARALAKGRPLRHLGAFTNERTRIGPLVLTPHGGPALLLELDRTSFPGGTVEHELEVELPSGADAGAVLGVLRALFAELGLESAPAPSKAARFFRLLDTPSPAPGDAGTEV